jgi:hypothetical protein
VRRALTWRTFGQPVLVGTSTILYIAVLVELGSTLIPASKARGA